VRRRRTDDRSRVRVREEVQPVYPEPGAGDEEASQAADETDRQTRIRIDGEVVEEEGLP